MSEHTIDNLFKGKITSTWMIASATIDITDASGNTVHSATILPVRNFEVYSSSSFIIDMAKFKKTCF